MVARARKRAAGTHDQLDRPLIKYLADRYLQHQLELDEAARWRQPLPSCQSDTLRDRETDYEESRELLEDRDLQGLLSYWGSFAQSFTHMIYRTTGNLCAVQILLGHSKIENTVRYLGVDVVDALVLAERIEI